MRYRYSILLSAFLAGVPCVGMPGTVTKLTHQPPEPVESTFQLTDGTVLAYGFGHNWWKLTPDNVGSYLNGTWTQVAGLPAGYIPDAMAEGVLADGRVVVAGGEYNNGAFAFTNKSAIYDPLADTWTDITPPDSLIPFIGDSPATVLPDGRFVIGEKFKKKVFGLDPKTLIWSELPSTHKHDFNAEEGWTLLPDGSILTYDVKSHPKSERYLPDEGKWVDAGSTIVDLRGAENCCGHCIPYGPKQKCYDPPGEVGAAILRPDGTVFATGSMPEGESRGHTSIYSPPRRLETKGHWTPGPDFPVGDDSFDSPSALLPNGNVLVKSSRGYLYEFDGTTLTRELFFSGFPILMVLPTGEVLVDGSAVYQGTGNYLQSWAPTISEFPASVKRGSTYKISGTQFNGLSQGSALGDEYESHTNYPLVRITNIASGHVFYARTYDHSTMGVATGNTPVFTHFDVPASMETGAGSLEVVANGIPSKSVLIAVR